MNISKALKIFFIFLSLIFTFSCSIIKNPSKIDNYVLFHTCHGDFVIGTYSYCKVHSSNFVTNVNNGVYDSTNFYSIIPNGILKAGICANTEEQTFMKENLKEKKCLKPEIHNQLINQKYAVGMWRLADSDNPEKLSDPVIFYIVHGIVSDEKNLQALEAKRNAPLIADYMTIWLNKPENKHFRDSLDFYKSSGNNKQYLRLYGELSKNVIPLIKRDGKNLFSLDEYQKKVYKSVGGIPIYDYNYTIFGQILYGYDVIEKITKIKTKINNKPSENITIISAKVISDKKFKKLKN